MYGRFRFEDHQHTSLWLPLDFSNEASFHTVLAYAALHQAVLRGEAASPMAIMHKTKAIQIINQWLEDPARATSDATIAAVLRQIVIVGSSSHCAFACGRRKQVSRESKRHDTKN